VRIVKETGRPVAQVARDLGISPYTLHNCVKFDRERDGQSGALGESEREEGNATRSLPEGRSPPRSGWWRNA
jgi:transposase